MKPKKPINLKKLLSFVVFVAVIWGLFAKFYTAENYSEPNSPYYSGNYVVNSPSPVKIKPLTVVSYNVWFGENIDRVVLEMKEIEAQSGLDILLLQEMDEVGTEMIARELEMNYIYFPAAVEPTYDKNFGNAILSRWPITDAQKLILPHKSLSNRMNRIATRATIQIGHMDVLVYSVHTESVFTLPSLRDDQYEAVLNDIDPEASFIIVGGDFNSFTDASVESLEATYRKAGLARVSENGGNTVNKYGIELSPDHIFAKGFMIEKAGVLTTATASDHFPVWATLVLK
jgi:endonuclease/exonuclease/phosphatase family metal-dependent hydrolase